MVSTGDDETTHDVFVSFTESDGDWVRGYLLQAFSQAGVRYRTEDDFPLGSARLDQIDRATRSCRRIVIILSPAYLTDSHAEFVNLIFQHEGMRNRDWSLVPVLLHPVAALPARIAALVGVSATDPSTWEHVVAQLCLDMAKPPPGDTAVPPCPYPGMLAFTEDEHESFFGREALVEDLLGRVQLGAQRCVTVIGPSGSGKSSLVRAGLLPRLRRLSLEGDVDWDICVIRPGLDPLGTLNTALRGVGLAPSDWSDREPQVGTPRLVLVVDQLEELFFAQASSGAAEFQRTLLELIAVPGRTVVCTMRADFYAQLMSSPLWPVVSGGRIDVVPISGAALRRAITEPALRVGVHLEATLVERLLHDAEGQVGALPLVQETLVHLWGRLRRGYLPRSAYDDIVAAGHGGGTGRPALQVALHQRADGAMADIRGLPGGERLAKQTLLRLIQFGEGRDDVRRQQPRDALASASDDHALFDEVLDRLRRNGLITLTATDDGRPPSVDISHEELIRSWPTLRSWIEARGDAEVRRRALMEKVHEWEELGRAGAHLDEVEIEEARRWKESAAAVELGNDPRLDALIEASQRILDEQQAFRDETRRREFRRNRVLRALLSVAIVLFLLTTGFMIFAFVQTRQAQHEANVARSGELSFAARALADTTPDTAAIMAQVADDLVDSARTRGALLAVLQARPEIVRTYQGQSGVLGSLAVSPDGQVVAAGGDDRSVTLWSTRSGRIVGTALRLPDAVRGIAFSPRGDVVAVGTRDGHVRLYDAATARPLGPDLRMPGGGVRDVVWSPDGRLLAAGGLGHTVTLWDTASWRPSQILARLAGPAESLAFSPDSGRLAIGLGTPSNAGQHDGGLIIADITTGQLDVVPPIPVGSPTVRGVAYNPTGTLLAAASEDAHVHLIDVGSGREVTALAGHRGRVYDVGFSRDGALLASTSRDRTVRLWDVAGRRPASFPELASGDPARGIVFLPDGTLLTSTSGHRVVQWRLSARSRLVLNADTAPGDVRPVTSATTYSPDGRLLATSFGDTVILRSGLTGETDRTGATTRTITVTGPLSSLSFAHDGRELITVTYAGVLGRWDVATGRPLTPERYTGQGSVLGVTVDPAGRTIATAGEDGSIRLWARTTLTMIGTPLHDQDGAVRAVAFSPRGDRLAAGGDDGTVQVWRMDVSPPRVDRLGSISLPTSIAFSPDGRWLAVGTDDGLISVWTSDPADAEHRLRPEAQLTAQRLGVKSVAFARDGRTIASGGDDGTVDLWDWEPDSHTLQRLGLPLLSGDRPEAGTTTATVLSVAFRADGRTLASTGPNGLVLWDVDKTSWRRRGCEVAGRNPSDSELSAWTGSTRRPRPCPGLPVISDDDDAPVD